MKRGVPPTAPNARTGELTPPGVTSRARAYKAALCVGSESGTRPLCPISYSVIGPTTSIRPFTRVAVGTYTSGIADISGAVTSNRHAFAGVLGVMKGCAGRHIDVASAY
jgi:hypothetical protein